MKKHNFSAGPCILPQEVLEKASKAILNFNDDHLSLIEISHRSTPFIDVMNEAKQLVKDLLAVPDNYSILFLQGGASLEFLMVPFNLLSKNGKCAYINTGTWSKKAIKEAKNLGDTKVIGPLLVGLGLPIEIAPLRTSTSELINLASIAAYSADVIDYKIN